jgi:hypothetical protein
MACSGKGITTAPMALCTRFATSWAAVEKHLPEKALRGLVMLVRTTRKLYHINDLYIYIIIYLCVCAYIYLFIYLFVYLCIHLFIRLFISIHIECTGRHMYTCTQFSNLLYPPCISICLSICRSIYLSNSIHLYNLYI